MVSPPPADDAPADVDCSVLETTLIGIDGFIDLSDGAAPVRISALVNPTTCGSFNGLVNAFSGRTISFTSGTELISTPGRYGLMPAFIGVING